LGLESTPEEYVEKIVTVFREVRRVLRDDGTLWLNLGDSYSRGERVNNPNDHKRGTGFHEEITEAGVYAQAGKATGLESKQLIGVPWRVAFALQQPYEKPHCIRSEIDRAWMAALVDGEGCISIRRYDSHSNGLDEARCQDGFVPFISIGNNDRELLDRCVAITGYGTVGVKDRPDVDSRGIKSRRTYYGWRLDGNKAMDVIRAIYPHLIAKRRQAVICHNLDLSKNNGKALRGNGALPASEQERREYMKALINACNQRQPVTMPDWMVDVKREIEPGWYLRQDIIWAKPNPMPESVTDRCTKAHEYLFLLAKSKRYYFDAAAIAEESVYKHGEGGHQRFGAPGGKAEVEYGKQVSGEIWNSNGTRNKRSVWTVATQPYSESHFATFPPDLIEPCILASSKPGDVVLDPFAGSGTTGQVAEALGRRWLLIELNDEYAKLCADRTRQMGIVMA
jgi:DNA modification methylase